VLILGVILGAYRIFLYTGSSKTLYQDKNKELMIKAQDFADIVRLQLDSFGLGTADLSSAMNQVWSEIKPQLQLTNDYVCILASDGKVITKSENFKNNIPFLSTQELERLNNGETVFKNLHFKKQHFRLINRPFSYTTRQHYIIQIATPIDELLGILHKRIRDSFIAIPIILLIAHFFSRIIVYRIIHPVERISKTAQNISLTHLSSRVPVEGLEEEMKYLAQSFNQMIGRLERSFEYVKEFSASIGHELKTPIAIIKGESEVALRKERQIEDYQNVLKVNIEEANRMIHIIEDLLFLTKLDYNPGNIKKERFDFADFFKEIQTRAATLASHKNITLNAELPQTVITTEGNKLHLSRMFFNIIQNAIKFTPEGGRIDIMVESAQDKIRVAITDNGPGISDKDLPKIFQRFFHSDKFKSESSEGTGLGLSIAKSIAQFHNGDIEVRSKFGDGATFTVSLPIIHS
jgi:heavy metal sensor kinase